MIILKLEIDEVNRILHALGAQPYIQVADLIQKIKTQGEAQMAPPEVVVETPTE